MQMIIKSVKYFSCGYCTNNLALVFDGMRGKRKFPAGAYLIDHKKYGPVIFDTGYSANITKTGLVGRIYNVFNPTTVEKSDELKPQLAKIGIDSGNVGMVILSHLHPDHIGGLKDFNKARFIVSKEVLNTYRNHRLQDLIMKDFFPTNFEERIDEVSDDMMTTKVLDNIKGYDLFGDDSLILLRLDGHAGGQLGALVNRKILLAADSCWGNDLMDASYRMKFPASAVQNNMEKYRQTLDVLKRLKNKGIQLMFSHDTYDKKELL